MQQEKEWFENWFNTPFYHILYDYRNDDEAEYFMNNLAGFLKLEQGNSVLDLPCGKGRHSLFLNALGYNTTGADLSANSIAHAKQFEKPGLSFEIHDMRNPLQGRYDAIFNLFTSFGYFNRETTNIEVFKNFKEALKPNGHIVVDFLNLEKVINDLVPEQQFSKKGIDFKIRKKVSDNFIIKEIEVISGKDTYHFEERVQALDLDKFKYFAEISGLEIEHVFGDYSLNDFNSVSSDRLILVLR